jgi:hypothetical protein
MNLVFFPRVLPNFFTIEGAKKARGIPSNEKCANYQKAVLGFRQPQTDVFSFKAKALSADCLKDSYPTAGLKKLFSTDTVYRYMMDQMWNATVD